MQRGRWLFVFGLGVCASVVAQQTPNAAPAFRAEGLYDYSGFDQVSLFSGGLSAQIPITTFGAEVQVPIVLSYSSSAWEARPTTCPPSNGICGAIMKPKPSDKVGLGFKVTLGELYQPAFGSNQAINRWVYVSWDGAEHALYPKLHPDDPQDVGDPDPSTGMFEKVMYSRDSSYVRVKCTSANFGDCTVETADGLRHFFNRTGTVQAPNYRLESITDRFGNAVTITYDSNPTRWTITDGHTDPDTNPERKVVLTFEPPVSGALDQPLLLQTIEAPCFLATGESTCRGSSNSVATWTFSYGDNPRLTYPPSVYTQSPEQRAVWFLDSVELPDGSMFSFPDYATAFHGGLESAILPTFGRLEWEWDSLLLPSVRNDSNCPAELSPYAEYWNSTYAVIQRRQFDLGGSPLGVWNYTREPDVEEPGVGEILTVTVESPLHDLSQYFFAIWAANFCYIPNHQSAQWEYGLPYSRASEDSVASTPKRFLSATHYDCQNAPNPVLGSCTLKRSVYQAWEVDDGDSIGGWNNGEVHDRNRRMRSERTIFHEPTGDKYKLTQFSNFDGLGHYRTTVLSHDVAGHDRTTSTSFNDARGEYTGLPGQVYDPIDASNLNEYWVLGTFVDQSTSESSIVNDPSGTSTQTAKEEFCFDGATGFLKRHRRFSSNTGVSRSGNDVLLLRTVDAANGHLQSEQWYGGDGDAFALDTAQPICDMPIPSTSRYWMDHGYENGSRSSSQWKDVNGNAGSPGPLAFLVLDRKIDARTGLIRSSKDVSTLESKFVYDSSGRLLEVQAPAVGVAPSSPPAWDVYSYTNATSTDGAVVTHKSFSNGSNSGTPLREEQWVYEGLGRIRRERRLAKDGQYDDRFSYYDLAGHRAYLSEWGRGGTTANFGLEWGDFDPFGRPGRISRFSNNAFLRDEAVMTYVGESKVTRTQWIATSAPSGTPVEEAVQRVETFDEHGRLSKVEEFSGGGTAIATTYEYDVGNRLRHAKTPASTGGDQKRWWMFDQRGFLLSETVPEKGAAGNGTVTYSAYDPLGNSGQRIDGLEVASIFDRAGRLTQVDEVISGVHRPLKQFFFGETNVGTDYALGKLTSAVGYNWIVVGGVTGFDARFVEGFRYQGTGGARSERNVTFKYGGAPIVPPVGWVPPADQPSYERFMHQEAFNALGQRSSIVYPKCIELTFQCPAGQPSRTLTTGYTNGFLTTVADASQNWVTSATYHRSGLWNTMGRGNGLTETQAQDALAIARPASIQASGTLASWTSGSHSYDRSGNLTRLVGTDEGGNDLFLYDKVSRLKEARIQVPTDRGALLFGDGFESATSQRWLEAWPPSGWSPGLKTQLFTFDRFGNLTQVQTTGQATENFPTTETTNRMSNAIATYDSRGNLTIYNDGSTSFTNSFDALNRQWKRVAPDGTDDYYLYTADDERILTFSPSTAMAWHWILRDFGGKVLRNYEFINSAPPAAVFVAAVKDYIHAGERVLGTEDPRVPGASAMYATVDHLGTPRLWTDATGNDVRKLKYYPFGKEATPSDQWNVALQFTGHERDRNDLTLATDDGDYMHARNTSAISGRFLSPDPLTSSASKNLPQRWNRFAYVGGNPLRFRDPSGLYSCTGTEAQCASFEAARQATLGSAKATDEEKAAAAAYGTPGHENGITVGFGERDTGKAAEAKLHPEGNHDDKGNFTKGFRIEGIVTFDPKLEGTLLQGAVVHEGQHVADGAAFAASFGDDGKKWSDSLNLTGAMAEINAYRMTARTATLTGATFALDGGTFKPHMRQAEVDRVTKRILETYKKDYLSTSAFNWDLVSP